MWTSNVAEQCQSPYGNEKIKNFTLGMLLVSARGSIFSTFYCRFWKQPFKWSGSCRYFLMIDFSLQPHTPPLLFHSKKTQHFWFPSSSLNSVKSHVTINFKHLYQASSHLLQVEVLLLLPLSFKASGLTDFWVHLYWWTLLLYAVTVIEGTWPRCLSR